MFSDVRMLVRLAAVLLFTVALGACASEDREAPSKVADACTGSPATDAPSALMATPKDLCEVDGKAWRWSSFALILQTPATVDSGDRRCYSTFRSAYRAALQHVQGASKTLAVQQGSGDLASGSILLATFDRGGPAAAESLEAMVTRCRLERVEHNGWIGFDDSGTESSGPRTTYWRQQGSSWALVQTSFHGMSDAEIDEITADTRTVLDVQGGRLDG